MGTWGKSSKLRACSSEQKPQTSVQKNWHLPAPGDVRKGNDNIGFIACFGIGAFPSGWQVFVASGFGCLSAGISLGSLACMLCWRGVVQRCSIGAVLSTIASIFVREKQPQKSALLRCLAWIYMTA